MLYLIRSFLRGGKQVYKIGYSNKENIDNRLRSYFYSAPGTEVISTREGDEIHEKLLHRYLYFLDLRFQMYGRLEEWFISDPRVFQVFHISFETLERKVWKHREEIFNVTSKTSSDYRIFEYLYLKYSDKFKSCSIDLKFLKIYNSLNEEQLLSTLSQEVSSFLSNKFLMTGIFEKRMKMYCEFCDQYKNSKFIEELNFFLGETRYKTYYNLLGTAGCRANSYKESRLVSSIMNVSKESNLAAKIYTTFSLDNRYSLKDIKITLKSIYSDLGIMKNPKATDLDKYFKLVRVKFYDSETKKRIEGYKLEKLS